MIITVVRDSHELTQVADLKCTERVRGTACRSLILRGMFTQLLLDIPDNWFICESFCLPNLFSKLSMISHALSNLLSIFIYAKPLFGIKILNSNEQR